MNRYRKRAYLPPLIVGSATLELERGVLTASVVDSVTSVETTGQEIKDGSIYDAGTTSPSSATFNYDWGE